MPILLATVRKKWTVIRSASEEISTYECGTMKAYRMLQDKGEHIATQKLDLNDY